MFPFHGAGYHEFMMEKNERPEYGGGHGKSNKKDHEVVPLPLSPRHSANSGIHLLAKSRMAWLIAILLLVLLILLYQAYFEHLRQLRLIEYLERVDELKVSMERLQHSIKAGTMKLQQLQQMYNSSSNAM